jgi:hypothetical protein
MLMFANTLRELQRFDNDSWLLVEAGIAVEKWEDLASGNPVIVSVPGAMDPELAAYEELLANSAAAVVVPLADFDEGDTEVTLNLQPGQFLKWAQNYQMVNEIKTKELRDLTVNSFRPGFLQEGNYNQYSYQFQELVDKLIPTPKDPSMTLSQSNPLLAMAKGAPAIEPFITGTWTAAQLKDILTIWTDIMVYSAGSPLTVKKNDILPEYRIPVWELIHKISIDRSNPTETLVEALGLLGYELDEDNANVGLSMHSDPVGTMHQRRSEVDGETWICFDMIPDDENVWYVSNQLPCGALGKIWTDVETDNHYFYWNNDRLQKSADGLPLSTNTLAGLWQEDIAGQIYSEKPGWGTFEKDLTA